MTQQHVVLTLPGMERVRVRHESYRQAADRHLEIDVYDLPAGDARARPAVLFVSGYADPGALLMLGRKLKDWQAYIDWAKLVACAGLVGITYENEDPLADATHVLHHVLDNAESLGVDPRRIALWSCSGNVPNALALLARDHPSTHAITCAALLYGYTVDLDGCRAVAEAAEKWRFIDAMAGRSLETIASVPLLLVRAGADEFPGLNEAMDRFAQHLLAAGRSVSVVNHAAAPHAFDIADDGDASRAVIRHVLGFLSAHLAEHDTR